MIQQTSLDVYLNEDFERKANIQRKKVLKFFTEHPNHTNLECARALDLPASTVSGRRNELLENGLIINTGKRPCTITGITAFTWRRTSCH